MSTDFMEEVNKKQIVFGSQNETEVLGFRVARCNEEDFDEKQLLSEIIEGRYDLCRLKIPAEDEMASLKLHRTGMPFFFSGSIRRYKTPMKQKPSGEFLHPEMTYEMYDGSQDQLLMEMLRGTWGIYPLGYYRTPFVCELVDKEKEIESVFRFYRKSNLNSLNPDNSIMFMNDRGKYVGFFALNKIDGGLESHIGGILEPYRKGGYFLDMQRFIKNYCIDNQLSHFAFGARNENAEVQRIFQYEGYEPIGSENVFHILPMLSLGSILVDGLTLAIGETIWDALPQIQQLIHSHLQDMKIISVKTVQVKDIDPSAASKLKISLPVKTESHFLVVAQQYDEDGQLCKCHYIEGQIPG